MSRVTRSLSLIAGCFLAASALPTEVFASEAKVVRKTGSGPASYTAPGGEKVAITGGEMIPERSTVETGPGVEIALEAFPGAVASLRQNSQVVLDELSASTRKARLNLKSGGIVSELDPAKSRETDYRVVTPNGEASARGTVFSVMLVPAAGGGANTTVATLSGMVIIDRGPGLPPLQVPYGQGSANSAAGLALAALVASDPTVAADILAAVQAVAANFASNTSASSTPGGATSLLAAVTSAAISAVPSQAGAFVQAAMQGVVTAGSEASGSQLDTLAAASAITEAAVRAVATNNPEQISSITQAAASAVTSSGSTTGGSDAALSAALSTITAAAVNAAPDHAAAAARGAAQGLVSTKVSDAINAAKAANPNLTPEQLAQIANDAANSSGAATGLSAIGTSATTMSLAVSGQAGNSVASTATASGIADAVNAGSNSGAAGTALSMIGATTTVVTGTQVTIAVSQVPGGTTVVSNAGTGLITSTATQRVAGSNIGVLRLSITTPGGTTSEVIAPPNLARPAGAGLGTDRLSQVLSPLDQTQVIVSPSRP